MNLEHRGENGVQMLVRYVGLKNIYGHTFEVWRRQTPVALVLGADEDDDQADGGDGGHDDQQDDKEEMAIDAYVVCKPRPISANKAKIDKRKGRINDKY